MPLGEGISDYCWIDDEHIVYTAALEEEKLYREKGGLVSGFYRLNVKSGEVEKLFSLPLNVGEIKFNEGRYVFAAVVNKNRPDIEKMPAAEAEIALELQKKRAGLSSF